MNYELRLSGRAVRHLIDLERYLTERFSADNAAEYIQRILRECESLTLAPFRGTSHSDIRPGLRTIGFERRVTIAFQVLPATVLITGIFYGGRKLH